MSTRFLAFWIAFIVSFTLGIATPTLLHGIEIVRGKTSSGATATALPKALPDGVAEPPSYRIKDPAYHQGEKLMFQASWIGIPVATARVELRRKKRDAGVWTAEAWINTNQFADIFFKMRDYMSEDLDPRSLMSRQMYIHQSENKRVNDFNVSFDRSEGLVTLVKRNRKGQEVKRFSSTNPWGPLSGAMMALSLPLTVGQHYAVDVFTGSTRYVFDFRVVDRERLTTGLGTFDAFRLVPAVNYESDGKLSQSTTGTVIWVSADDRRLPLRAESQAFIGTVRADLIEVNG